MTKTRPTDTGACGTNPGYHRHLRAGEHACDPCKAAHADHLREYQRTPQGRAARTAYRQTPNGQDVQRRAKAKYKTTPKGRAAKHRAYARKAALRVGRQGDEAFIEGYLAGFTSGHRAGARKR